MGGFINSPTSTSFSVDPFNKVISRTSGRVVLGFCLTFWEEFKSWESSNTKALGEISPCVTIDFRDDNIINTSIRGSNFLIGLSTKKNNKKENKKENKNINKYSIFILLFFSFSFYI